MALEGNILISTIITFLQEFRNSAPLQLTWSKNRQDMELAIHTKKLHLGNLKILHPNPIDDCCSCLLNVAIRDPLRLSLSMCVYMLQSQGVLVNRLLILYKVLSFYI